MTKNTKQFIGALLFILFIITSIVLGVNETKKEISQRVNSNVDVCDTQCDLLGELSEIGFEQE